VTTVTIKVDKGVNKDILPSELPDGFVSDCSNFRFRNGFAEKFNGGVSVNATIGAGSAVSITNSGAWLFPIQAAGAPYAVLGSGSRAWAITGSTYGSSVIYEITRYVKSQTISSLTRIGANTAQITTASAHGLSTGDQVTVFGAVESGYNQTATITVISTTVFQYTTTATIGANATTVGQYVVYQSTAISTFSGDTYSVTGGPLNGILATYMPTDGLYYWAALSTSTYLRQMPFVVPSGVTALRPFKYYLVALAGKIVYWTDSAQPGSIPTTFTASASNDSGQVTLAETNGMLVDCKPLGDVNIIYKEDSIYAQQYIGGNDVFAFTRLPGNDGLYGRNCVASTPVGHVFLTQNLDIKVHQGGAPRSIADGRVKNWLQNLSSFAITTTLPTAVSVITNPEKSEVWITFPSTGANVTANTALVWNWVDDTWGIFELSSSMSFVSGATGIWPSSMTTQQRLVVTTTASGGGLRIIDTATAAGNGLQLAAYLERTDLDLGDRETLKYIDRSRWNADPSGSLGTISVYHGAASYPNATPTYASVVSKTIGTQDYINNRGVQGRFVAVKMTTNYPTLTMRSADLDIKTGGKR
jgi:hypothetical protein